MGDIDEGDPQLLLDAFQLHLHLLPKLQIQGAQGLVQEQHLGMVHQRPGNGNPLLLAAGKLGDPAALKALEIHHGKHFLDALLDFLFRHLGNLQPEGHIVKHIQVGKKGVALKDGVDLPLVGRKIVDALSLKINITLIRIDEAPDNAQGRRLSTTGGAEQCDKLLVFHIEAHIVQHPILIVIKSDVFELKQSVIFANGHSLYPPLRIRRNEARRDAF